MPSNMAAALLKLGPKPVDPSGRQPSPLDDAQQHKEMYTYAPFRYAGYAVALASLAIGIYAVVNKNWIRTRVTLSEASNTTDFGLGIWETCYTELNGVQSSESEVDIESLCYSLALTRIPKWQSAIIGLLLFSLGFGLMATVLTTCGICSVSLAKKVYYYHSAGEMYFVCGVCATSALVAFPTVISTSPDMPKHEFGIGYYMAWGMPVCYFVSAFCMTLDDMIHSLSNECCLMCRSKQAKQSSKPAAV